MTIDFRPASLETGVAFPGVTGGVGETRADLASIAGFGTALAAGLVRRADFVELGTIDARGAAGLEAVKDAGAVESLRDTAGIVVVPVVGEALEAATPADIAFGAVEIDDVGGFFEAEITPAGLKPEEGMTDGLPAIAFTGGGADDFGKGRVPGLATVAVILVRASVILLLVDEGADWTASGMTTGAKEAGSLSVSSQVRISVTLN